jgi:phage host-nuclease inhibitor protein Gam
MAKKTKTATTIKNREELEQVMGEYAAQVLERDRLTVCMEQEIAEIRSRYEQPLSACVQVGDGLFEDLCAWAALNPDAFAERRSLELLHGRIGFRAGLPAVRQLAGVKADHSVDLLLAACPDWVRTKWEIDKEQILADISKGDASEEALRPFGLRIERAETFFAEARREADAPE